MKSLLSEKTALEPAKQRLIYLGRVLRDSTSLDSYGKAAAAAGPEEEERRERERERRERRESELREEFIVGYTCLRIPTLTYSLGLKDDCVVHLVTTGVPNPVSSPSSQPALHSSDNNSQLSSTESSPSSEDQIIFTASLEVDSITQQESDQQQQQRQTQPQINVQPLSFVGPNGSFPTFGKYDDTVPLCRTGSIDGCF